MIPQDLSTYIRDNFRKGRVVCLTGAGISAESGIPTFRGKGGLWEKYNPQVYANAEGLISLLRSNPKKLADFITDFYSMLLPAYPNPAHFALAELEKQGILSSVITQNIDNLHQESGSRKVIEVHGNSFRIVCMSCKKKIILKKEEIKELLSSFSSERYSSIGVLRVISRYFPKCKCGGRFRIDIVLFGEMLPEDEIAQAYQELEHCQTLLIVGSSLVVYPAAGLPLFAKQRGVKLIEVNSEPSALSELSDYMITDEASEVLPEIIKILSS
ncbi:MAG: NAD-dependent deacylase [Candidatus Omnitrophota bacterium]